MGVSGKEESAYLGRHITVVHAGGQTEGICAGVDVYLNVAVQTPESVHIIKGEHIRKIVEKQPLAERKANETR
ncbi:uncharacterized protein NEMAJ01_0009 [Nematocida major]|uniref:uncharacterized protein n=1 Tax=Nematocida major TaxID=1912982 RepID=UPI00200827F1|nr:uncharacterized protein NEMAJ01_0009 [Nematocida major]KAH9385113.1 hypothetical protein NEMAJ01_0009 [Nematocida major]